MERRWTQLYHRREGAATPRPDDNLAVFGRRMKGAPMHNPVCGTLSGQGFQYAEIRKKPGIFDILETRAVAVELKWKRRTRRSAGISDDFLPSLRRNPKGHFGSPALSGYSDLGWLDPG